MSEELNLFDQVTHLTENSGTDSALVFLAEHYRQEHKHHQLFEILKMQTRNRLNLPLLYGSMPDSIDEPTRRKLEDGLLEACTEVGTLLIEAGQLHEGWVYLQPVGDRELNCKLISGVPQTDDNTDALVEIALSQGAAPEFGYQLVLQNYGTCNAITTMDTHGMQFDLATRQRLAAMLVIHLYNELTANIALHIEREKGADAVAAIDDAASLRVLLREHSWVTEGGSHHIDATHLASVMRIGQVVTDPEALAMLVEMAEYGKNLAADFHYPGSPPFEDSYRDYLIYYCALASTNPDSQEVSEAVRHFDQKVKSTDAQQHGPVAVETLVDLLTRTGRRQQALDVAIEHLAGQGNASGITPVVFEIAQTDEELDNVIQFFREREDLLGYSIGLLKKQSNGPR